MHQYLFNIFLCYFYRNTERKTVVFQQKNAHNHRTNCAASLKFRKPLAHVVERFDLLFNENLGPFQARQKYMDDLKTEYGEDFYKVAGDNAVCPNQKWVYNLYYRIFKKKYGPRYGDDMISNLEESVRAYNDECQDICAATGCLQILKSDETDKKADGEKRSLPAFYVAIVTPTMKRIHEYISQSAEILFVDSTGM